MLREEFSVCPELPTPEGVTFALSPGNSAGDVDALVRAFKILASRREQVGGRGGALFKILAV